MGDRQPAGAGRRGRARRPGIVRYEPDDLTVTVGAGTSFAELDAALAEHGQECPLDPRDPAATVGGIIACGLSGIRRLRHGPLRDHVLEVRFVTADGRLVKGGGPDRQERDRLRPAAAVRRLVRHARRARAADAAVPAPRRARRAGSGPTTPVDRFRAARDAVGRPAGVRCCSKAPQADVDAQSAGPRRECEPPALPDRRAPRPDLGRRPARSTAIGARARRGPGRPLVRGARRRHRARRRRRRVRARRRARGIAHDHDGWLLREAGGDGLDGFGRALPNADADAPGQGRVRPDRQARARDGCRYDRRARARSISTPTSSSRACRAGCACRTARRTASPGSRSRHHAAGSPRCGSSSSKAGRSTTRSRPR